VLTPRAIGDAPGSPGAPKPKNPQVQRHPNRNRNPPRSPRNNPPPPQPPSGPQPQKPPPRPKPRSTTTRQKASRRQPRQKRDFGPVPRIESVADLESAAGAFEGKIKTAMSDSTRTRVEPQKKENLPQWIVDLIRAKNLARRQAYRTGSAADRTEANRLGNEVKFALIDHRSDRWERKLKSLTADDNSIWRMTKALRSNKKPLPPIHSTRGLVFSDDEKAETFADSLELQCRPNIADADLDHIEEVEHEIHETLSEPNDTPITPTSPEEVREIIGSLKVKKAPGPDHIPNTALKLLPDKVVVALTAIINASLRLCHFPSRWKRANVIFIPKPGKDPKFPQNYRPISLLSNVGKIVEKVILTRLVKMANDNAAIPDEQFGFRPKHSTADQLIHVTEFISHGMNQNKSTGAIFLDVAKAFDTVWHDGLVYKLHTAGLPLAMVKLINSFLQNRVFHAKIGHALSTERAIEAGVPQGSVLSPTLYAIFTADIPKPAEQNSRCMQTTLQSSRARGLPNSRRNGSKTLLKAWKRGSAYGGST
jgi:hypothetical protein